MPGTVRMYPTDPKTGERAGPTVDVPEEQARAMQGRGFATESTSERVSTAIEGAREDYYSRPAAKVAAGLGAAARLGTVGLSDAAIRAFGSEQDIADTAALREYNKPLTTAIEVGGSLLPVGAAGVATQLGERAAARIAGKGALSDIVRSGVAGGVEAGIGAGGESISRVSLSDKPIDIENTLAQFSSDALFGGGVGGVAGSLGKAAEITLKRGAARLRAVRGAVAGGEDIAPEFAGKSVDELADDAKLERAQLAEQQVRKKASVVDDTTAYRNKLRDENPFLVIKGSESSDLANTTKRLDEALKTPDALANNPGELSKVLEKQGNALKKAIAGRDEIAARLDDLNQKIATEVSERVGKVAPDAKTVKLSGDSMKRYGQFADVRIPNKTKSLDVSLDDANRFVTALQSGAAQTAEHKSLAALDGVLEANQQLRASVRDAMVPEHKLTSDRLGQIERASAAAKAAANRKPGAIEELAQSAIIGYGASATSDVPFVGALIGAKLARHATGALFGKVGRATAEAASRTGKAIDTFLDVAKKPAKRVPVIASKVLSRVRYAHASDAEREQQAGEAASGKADLATLYNRRAAEIRSQTEYGPEGKAQMTAAARERLAQKLSPIAAHDPIIADKMETVAARRIEFLANVMPRRPEITGVPIGPDKWRPSDLEMRQFARYVHAVEDPYGVVERLATNDITPEDARALREVYPDIFHEVRWKIAQALPELRQQLPYARRVGLSIFSGVPVDAAMHPQILGVLQSQFAEEPGSEGGTTAPTAAPQFGSVSKPEPTAAQSRAG